MNKPKTIYLCEGCMFAFNEGFMKLNYTPKTPVSILLADKKHPCQITQQDNKKVPIIIE